MNWLERRQVKFSQAFVAGIVAVFPAYMLVVLAQPLVNSSPGAAPMVGLIYLLAVPTGFFGQAVAVRWRFQIPFGRACLVSLVAGAIGLAICIAFSVAALLLLPRVPTP